MSMRTLHHPDFGRQTFPIMNSGSYSTLTWSPTLIPFGAPPLPYVAPARQQVPPPPTRLKRKLLKRGKTEPEFLPIPLDASGRPQLRDGAFEIFRQLDCFGPGRHYGVLIIQGGMTTAYESQKGGGFRKATYEEFAQGYKVFMTAWLPGFQGIIDATRRLNDAREVYRTWELWEKNCQHMSSFVIHGKHQSAQIEGLKALVGVLVVAAIVGIASA